MLIQSLKTAVLVWVTCLLASCISDQKEGQVQICIPAGQCPDIPMQTGEFEGDLTRGASIFEKACASCHGPKGNGIQEKGTRDLTNHGFQKTMTDRQIRMSIRMGKGKMPSFVLPSQQLADLLVFVRSLDRGAPKGAKTPGY
jgi:mono/diheme cytochrome c family protein